MYSTLFRPTTKRSLFLICDLSYFRQSINDLSARELPVKSNPSLATEGRVSVTADKELKKNIGKDILIDEETTETGKVLGSIRTY